MKIKELIEKLSKYDPETKVLLRDSYHDVQYNIYSVSPGSKWNESDDTIVLWDGE